jgi:hypothetical protein
VDVICRIPITQKYGPLAVKELLDTLGRIAARELLVHPLPPLYTTGIRYAEEPNAGKFELWKCPVQTFEDGSGDCDDLVIYRLAELLASGERASAQCMAETRNGILTGRMHVRVRRADGSVEDPSFLVDKVRPK